MKYAVIGLSGSQYQVEEGDTLTIDNLNQKEDSLCSTDQVLLITDDKIIKIGNPLVKGAQVNYQIVKNHQGKKIKIFKYKAKTHYRRHLGFRSQLTDIKITKISVKAASPKPKSPKKVKIKNGTH